MHHRCQSYTATGNGLRIEFEGGIFPDVLAKLQSQPRRVNADVRRPPPGLELELVTAIIRAKENHRGCTR